MPEIIRVEHSLSTSYIPGTQRGILSHLYYHSPLHREGNQSVSKVICVALSYSHQLGILIPEPVSFTVLPTADRLGVSEQLTWIEAFL